MNLRPATLMDAELLFQWRTQNEAAAPWYGSPPTTRADHDKWLADRVDNPCVRIWILEEDDTPLGSARLDSNGEVTVEIDPAFRGKGYGVTALRWVVGQAGGRVKANVDEGNTFCRGMLRGAGFTHRPDVEFWLWRA